MKIDYKTKQAKWIKRYNIRVGDEVIVTTYAEDFENGWAAIWNHRMYRYVGKRIKIIEIDGNYGMGMKEGWYFPYFVLKPVKTWKPKEYETVWRINLIDLSVQKTQYYHSMYYDYGMGLLYRTRQEARDKASKIKAILKS